MFYCVRCGYETDRRYSLKLHLNKKKKCEAIISDLTPEECLKMCDDKEKIIKIMSKKIKSNVYCLKEDINLLKKEQNEKDKEIEKLKKQLEQMNFNKLKIKNAIDDLNENIYIIQPRSCVETGENVYKLGRTNNLKLRFDKYCKGGLQKLTYPCNNAKEIERELIKQFNQEFKRRQDYGKEYYQGDLQKMVKIVTTYLLKSDTMCKENKL